MIWESRRRRLADLQRSSHAAHPDRPLRSRCNRPVRCRKRAYRRPAGFLGTMATKTVQRMVLAPSLGVRLAYGRPSGDGRRAREGRGDSGCVGFQTYRRQRDSIRSSRVRHRPGPAGQVLCWRGSSTSLRSVSRMGMPSSESISKWEVAIVTLPMDTVSVDDDYMIRRYRENFVLPLSIAAHELLMAQFRPGPRTAAEAGMKAVALIDLQGRDAMAAAGSSECRRCWPGSIGRPMR